MARASIRDGRPVLLYDALHAHVRASLVKTYGADKVPADGPIPAHLLGLTDRTLPMRASAARSLGGLEGVANDLVVGMEGKALMALCASAVFGAPASEADALPVFDENGRPRHRRGVTEVPGLHFLGLTWQWTRGSALIGWVKDDAEFIAWRHPRVFSHAQFQLYDVPPRTEFPVDTPAYWATYQSGLFTALPEGAAKPGANAYKFGLVVRRRGKRVRIWGQARFAPNGATYPISIQRRAPGASDWVQVGDLIQVTNSQGYFRARRPNQRGATWRAVWWEPDFSRFEISREAVAR